MKDFIESGYDPDSEPEARQKKISIEDLYRRTAIPRSVMVGKESKPTRITGQFVLHEGATRRVVQVMGWDQVRKLTESTAYQVSKLREVAAPLHPRAIINRFRETNGAHFKEEFGTDWFSLGSPSDETTTPGSTDGTFHPLMLGPFNRNLYLYDFLDQASKAFEAWNHNPLAKAIVSIMCHFILADGFKVKFHSARMQEEFDKWCEGVNWNEKWRLLVKDAEIVGETFLHDPDGLSMKIWDATTVWEIMTNPRDINDVYYAYRQFPTQWQMPLSADGAPLPEGGKVQDYVIEQFPPEQWLQVKLNATVGEKRGRSTLFPNLTWLKRFRDWFNAVVVKAHINNAFVVWWQVNGGDADVQALKNNADFTTMPPPGSAWFTNMQVTPNLLTNQVGLSGSDRTGEALMTIIATCAGLPPEYLGVAGSAPRATGIKRGEPAMKMFESRQQIWREAISWKVRRWIEAAIREAIVPTTEPRPATVRRIIQEIRAKRYRGALNVLKALIIGGELEDKIDQGFEVIMPQVQPEDQAAAIKNLAIGRSTGVYSQETYATRFAELNDDKDYDYDAERERMEHEAEMGIYPPSAAGDTIPEEPPPDEGGAATEPDVKPGSAQDTAGYKARAQEKPPKA